MAQLSAEYESQHLQSLYDFYSDETKKARRNLVVTCFVIVAIHWVGLSLYDLKWLAADLSKADKTAVLWIAAGLVVYWGFQFGMYALRDWNLHREREYLMRKELRDLERDIESESEAIAARSMSSDSLAEHSGRLKRLKSIYKIHTRALGRTVWAIRVRSVAVLFEYVTPFALLVLALAYIWCDLGLPT